MKRDIMKLIGFFAVTPWDHYYGETSIMSEIMG